MRIRGWSVDSYGVLAADRADRIGDGLVVVFGPNESGKTTLAAFLRGALFGYPGRAAAGRGDGGRVFVESGAGEHWTIERRVGARRPRIHALTGERVEVERFALETRGVDADLYRSVYAFTSEEWTEIALADDRKLAELLADAGGFGSGPDLRLAADRWRREARALHDGRAASRLAEVARDLDAAERRLAAARAAVAEYETLGNACRVATDRVARAERALATERLRLARSSQRAAENPDSTAAAMVRARARFVAAVAAIRRIDAARPRASLPAADQLESWRAGAARLATLVEISAAAPKTQPGGVDAPAPSATAFLLFTVTGLAATLAAVATATNAYRAAIGAAVAAACLIVFCAWRGFAERLRLGRRRALSRSEARRWSRRLGLDGAIDADALARLRERLDRIAAAFDRERARREARASLVAAAVEARKAYRDAARRHRDGVRGLGATAAPRERELVEAVRAHRDIEARLEALEASGEIAALETAVAALRSERDRAVEDYRVFELARALVDKAEVRERERSHPEVLGEASSALARLTEGRYGRVVVDAEGRFAVIGQGGERVEASELSRGAREQLFLCIRLGLIEALSRRGLDLPLILDDVFVNFDDDRAEAAARLVASVAERRQVFFLTCRAATRDLLVRAARGEAFVVDRSLSVVERP